MTTSAVVQMFFYLHLGLILVATAYYAVSAAVAPRLARRSRDRFARRPWSPIIVGLLISTPWVFVAMVMLNANLPGVKLVGATLGILWVLCGLMGGAGIAQHIGGGSVESASWVQTLRGGLLISLTWILPLVGWLVVLPLTLAAGVGCMVQGIFSRGQAEPLSTVTVPAPVVA